MAQVGCPLTAGLQRRCREVCRHLSRCIIIPVGISLAGDRNLVDFYFDGGLEYKGPSGRANNTVGLAYGYARISDPARLLDMDIAAPRTFRPFRSTETVAELTYQFTLNPWWQLQPDLPVHHQSRRPHRQSKRPQSENRQRSSSRSRNN